MFRHRERKKWHHGLLCGIIGTESQSMQNHLFCIGTRLSGVSG
jgi:hypothetical protein